VAIKIALEPTESVRVAGEVDRLAAFPPLWVAPYVEDGKWTRCSNVLAVSDIEPDVDANLDAERRMCSQVPGSPWHRHLPSAPALSLPEPASAGTKSCGRSTNALRFRH
jgi:hypothetical protein